jgi:hypothetical protein
MYLIGNILWNIPLGLLEAETWLTSDGLKLYTDGTMFEGGAGSGVFSEKLEASFALGKFTVFQGEVYAILAYSDYCLDLHGQSGRFIGVKFTHRVIKADASVPKLSKGTFYS